MTASASKTVRACLAKGNHCTLCVQQSLEGASPSPSRKAARTDEYSTPTKGHLIMASSSASTPAGASPAREREAAHEEPADQLVANVADQPAPHSVAAQQPPVEPREENLSSKGSPSPNSSGIVPRCTQQKAVAFHLCRHPAGQSSAAHCCAASIYGHRVRRHCR